MHRVNEGLGVGGWGLGIRVGEGVRGEGVRGEGRGAKEESGELIPVYFSP